jgi:hypothetical protein
MLFEYIKRMRGIPQSVLAGRDFSDVNAEFLRSVSATDLYAFITYCGEVRKITVATRASRTSLSKIKLHCVSDVIGFYRCFKMKLKWCWGHCQSTGSLSYTAPYVGKGSLRIPIPKIGG